MLGLVPGQPQPSQKAFETQVWQALRALDPEREVFVESESRTIGRLRVPEALLQALRQSPCVHLLMPLQARVTFLLDDYAHFVEDVEAFCERLDALSELRGADVVARWQDLARAGDLPAVVEELLTLHYDPVYTRSMQRNFAQFGQALELDLPGGSDVTLAAAARQITSPPPA